jgi:hypothetical protein
MTISLKILLAAVFLAVGLSVFWIAEKQSKVGFSELEACHKQCAIEKKTGQLVPFSSTQITKRGDFTGPLKCQCI